jgi:hypothetical protein
MSQKSSLPQPTQSVSRVLAPAVRPAFLGLVAQSLAGAGEIGDGTVARVCAEAPQRFWVPPDLSRATGSSKWR